MGGGVGEVLGGRGRKARKNGWKCGNLYISDTSS